MESFNILKPYLKNEIPLTTPCFNVALNMSPHQYGVDQHWKWGAGKITDKYAWVVQHFSPSTQGVSQVNLHSKIIKPLWVYNTSLGSDEHS